MLLLKIVWARRDVWAYLGYACIHPFHPFQHHRHQPPLLHDNDDAINAHHHLICILQQSNQLFFISIFISPWKWNNQQSIYHLTMVTIDATLAKLSFNRCFLFLLEHNWSYFNENSIKNMKTKGSQHNL